MLCLKLRHDHELSIAAYITTSRRFKFQILGLLRIHIFIQLFPLIIYAYRLFAENVAFFRRAQPLLSKAQIKPFGLTECLLDRLSTSVRKEKTLLRRPIISV